MSRTYLQKINALGVAFCEAGPQPESGGVRGPRREAAGAVSSTCAARRMCQEAFTKERGKPELLFIRSAPLWMREEDEQEDEAIVADADSKVTASSSVSFEHLHWSERLIYLTVSSVSWSSELW